MKNTIALHQPKVFSWLPNGNFPLIGPPLMRPQQPDNDTLTREVNFLRYTVKHQVIELTMLQQQVKDLSLKIETMHFDY